VNGVPITATCDTEEEAVAELLIKLRDVERGTSEKPVRRRGELDTIDSWMWEFYLETTTGEGSVVSSTAGQYRRITDKILEPEYGLTGMLLVDVTAQVIKEFRRKLETVPTKRTGEPLGPSRRKAIEIRLNAALVAAVEEGKLDRNPFPKQADRRTTRRRQKQQREVSAERIEQEAIKERIDWYPQMAYLKLVNDFDQAEVAERAARKAVGLASEESIDQARKAAEQATQLADWAHTRLTMYLLSFFGLRPAEVRGLTIDKVSILKKTLRVEQQLAVYDPKIDGGKTGPYLKPETKTDAGKRILPLAEPLLSVLRVQANRQRRGYDEHRKELFEGKQLLLTARRGGPIRQQVHDDDWKELVSKELGLDLEQWPAMRLYANRHIAVTILQRAKFPIEVTSLVTGWSTKQNNLYDTYGWWTEEEAKSEAMKTIGQAILSKPTDPSYKTKVVGSIHDEPITQSEADEIQAQLDPGWDITDIMDTDPPDDWEV